MARKLHSVDDPFLTQATEVIDVRSPAEFEMDHMPGAINLPVLSNEERKEVGTIYKQQSSFKGRQIGAGIIAKNIGAMLSDYFSKKEEGYSPLIYCARGGQRSKSLATILSEVGWEVSLLKGGYKLYRSLIREKLPPLSNSLRYVVLSGLTGCGKSKILEALERKGAQVLHLERIAAHQGSLLGAIPGKPQPSQRHFESLLFRQMRYFDPSKVVWTEGESQKIGALFLPSTLHASMRECVSIRVVSPIEERVLFLIKQYPHFTRSPEELKQKLSQLKSLHGGEIIDRWNNLIDRGEFPALVEELLLRHYDPRYSKALTRNYGDSTPTVTLPSLREEAIDRAAENLLSIAAQGKLMTSELSRWGHGAGF